MKWASIWLRSLSTFSRNSRCGRDWMVESRKSLKARPSFRKKIDRSGHDEEQPGLLGDIGDPQSDALRQFGDVVAVADQERLQQVGRSLVPAMLGAELLRDLTGTELGQQGGQGLSQLRALARHFRTDHHKEHDDQNEKQAYR